MTRKEPILDKIRAAIEGYKSTINNAISEDELKIEGMKEAYADCLKIIDKFIQDDVTETIIKTLEQEPTTKSVTIKQLEEMYIKFEDKLWYESENVRGDEMIEVDYAEQLLEGLLAEFGCWDAEE